MPDCSAVMELKLTNLIMGRSRAGERDGLDGGGMTSGDRGVEGTWILEANCCCLDVITFGVDCGLKLPLPSRL